MAVYPTTAVQSLHGSPSMPSTPPVLLTAGHYYGTLAAVRCLGRTGVPVTLADGHALAPARWSRFVTRRIWCPEPNDAEAFLVWLLAFGAASPGYVLLPSSDEVAWLVAENREALERFYHLPRAPFSAVHGLLDKHALHGHCRAAGIGVPETRFPRSLGEALTDGAELGFPLILKPRTQVLLDSHSKGVLVEEPSELRARFHQFTADNRYHDRIRRRSPGVEWPMLQRYYAGAQESIYGLSGYVDGAGEIACVRATRKVLQRPRRLGVGICFEDAPVDEGSLEGLRALCRRVGYQGVFEVEYIEDGPRRALIDFNPRFYGQMAFDVDRGLPLPRLAYADALGDRAAFEALAAGARAPPLSRPSAHCHRFFFELMLRGQGLSGRLPAGEERRWRRWWEEHRAAATDAVADAGDPLPWGADVMNHLVHIARHPRSSFRTLFLEE
jgi:D-aspartate ligase